MLRIENPKIGADPELFVVNGGNVVSAIGLVGGSKEEPRPLEANGYFVQEDNVMVEFNIPPATSKEEFSSSILLGMDYVRRVLPKGNDLLVKSSHLFNKKDLKHPKAHVAGCDQDFDAWKTCTNGFIPLKTGLRSCGGHIHVGYDNHEYLVSLALVRAMDKYLGIPSVIMDSDKERKKLYGKSGACRIKNYGVEYRVLSNFWLGSPDLIKWAYEQTHKAIEFVNKGLDVDQELGEMIQLCIDNSVEDLAYKICEDNSDITIL